MQPVHYDELASLDLTYWWFQVRFAYVVRSIRCFARRPRLLVDVGCGTGGFLRYVDRAKEVVADQFLGVEQDQRAADIASGRGLSVIVSDIDGLASSITVQSVDVLTMLDVLEHIDDAPLALSKLRALVRPGGYIIVLVPAHQVLWSAWDEHLGHKRRYSKSLLSQQLRDAGWKPVAGRYLFSTMMLPGLIRNRLIGADRISATEFPRIPPFANKVLTRFLDVETKLPGLPFGTSVAMIAKNEP